MTLRLVVVSNRVPLPTSNANVGGLAIGVRALLEEFRRNDVANWRQGFLEALEAARRPGPVFAAAG